MNPTSFSEIMSRTEHPPNQTNILHVHARGRSIPSACWQATMLPCNHIDMATGHLTYFDYTKKHNQLLTEQHPHTTPMSLRFWRRLTILPGVTLNLSKSGGSLSVGPRGAKFTIGPKGARVTAGIPGTGLFYTKTLKPQSGSSGTAPHTSANLSMGFFKRLVTPDDEEALIDGCKELFEGREREALDHLRKARHLADGAWLAGVLAFRMGLLEEAENSLCSAVARKEQLGTLFTKYGLKPELTLPVTREISVLIRPNRSGTLLALGELYQRQERMADALRTIEQLHAIEPMDILARLSLAELLFEQHEASTPERIIRLADGVENDSELHAGLLLYKARALNTAGMHEAARTTLSAALRRTKGRSRELLHSLRYERALAYGKLGQKTRMRSDLERIYAENPDFGDVAAKLAE